MNHRTLLPSLVLCMILNAVAHAAETWPQFRGPTGDGDASSAKLPLNWSESTNVKWKTAIHGKAWSSPVVWGDRIWMTTATEDGKKMSAVCVDRNTGKIVQDIVVFENAEPRFCHPTNSYASPTPILEAGRLYVHFGSYGTACLNTKTGKTIWERRDFACNHWRGPGSSPVIAGDVMFVAYDGFDKQYVTALNKNTGKTEWKHDRNINYGTDNGDRMKAYSTALYIEHKDRKQFISPSAVETISYEVETGKELWRVKHGGMNAAIRPAYRHGLVYIFGGSGRTAMVAVKPDGSGDVTSTHIVYGLGRGVPKRPGPVMFGDYMFMLNDDGIANCVDAKTGEVKWQQRMEGSYRASPILADGRIYLFGMEGQMPVIKAKPTFELLTTNELEAGCQASPAVIGNQLYIRTLTHLYWIGK